MKYENISGMAKSSGWHQYEIWANQKREKSLSAAYHGWLSVSVAGENQPCG